MKRLVIISLLFSSCVTTNLASEVYYACCQSAKYFLIFMEKYPYPIGNNEALESKEWKEYVGWEQACDTAKSDYLDHK